MLRIAMQAGVEIPYSWQRVPWLKGGRGFVKGIGRKKRVYRSVAGEGFFGGVGGDALDGGL